MSEDKEIIKGLELFNNEAPVNITGLHIEIDGKSEEIIGAMLAQAREQDRVVEIMIRYRGIEKEFTFADFFKRLGFSEKEGGSDEQTAD